MTDEKKPGKGKIYDITDKLDLDADDEIITFRDINFTAAGDPIPLDPETGDILIEQLTDAQRAELEEAGRKLAALSKAFIDSDALQALKTFAENAREAFNEALNKSIDMEQLREAINLVRENIHPVQLLLNELDELKPYIEAELKKDEYGGLTLEDIYRNYTPGELLDARQDPDSLFYKVMEAAKATKEKAARVTIQRPSDIEYPLDKINANAWNLLTEDTGGQLGITFNLLPKRPNLQATAYYSINFDDLGDNVQITKRLQPFDKRVYIAVSALWNAGNDVITATQIYYAMGNTGKPAAKQIKKIDDALSKMTGARIYLDNTQEAKTAKVNYPQFKYDGSLLPIERLTAIVNGQISDSAVHIFREPPLMTFAKERKQVTTIDVALLQSPVNKTDANLQIDDYLIERISRAKHGKGNSCRILFEKLYTQAGITTRNQKSRAPEKVEKYLTYYQQQGFIKKYTMQPDGVTVYF